MLFFICAALPALFGKYVVLGLAVLVKSASLTITKWSARLLRGRADGKRTDSGWQWDSAQKHPIASVPGRCLARRSEQEHEEGRVGDAPR